MSDEKGGFFGANYATAVALLVGGGLLIANPEGSVPERFHPLELGGGTILLGLLCLAIAIQRTVIKMATGLLMLVGLAYGGLVLQSGTVEQANLRIKQWLGVALEKGKEKAKDALGEAVDQAGD